MACFWVPPESESWLAQVGLRDFAALPWSLWDANDEASAQWKIVKENEGHISDDKQITVEDISRIFMLPLVPNQEELPKVGTAEMKAIFGEPDSSRQHYSIAKRLDLRITRRYKWFLTFVCLKQKSQYISREHYGVIHAAELGMQVCWASFFYENYFQVVNDKRRRSSMERMRPYLAALFQGMGVTIPLQPRRLVSSFQGNGDSTMTSKKRKDKPFTMTQDDEEEDVNLTQRDKKPSVDDAPVTTLQVFTENTQRPTKRPTTRQLEESASGKLQEQTKEKGLNSGDTLHPLSTIHSPVAQDISWLLEQQEEVADTLLNMPETLNAHLSEKDNGKEQLQTRDLHHACQAHFAEPYKSAEESTTIRSATQSIQVAYEALQKHVTELKEKTAKFEKVHTWTVPVLLDNMKALSEIGFPLIAQNIQEAARIMFEASNRLSLTSESLLKVATDQEKVASAFHQNYCDEVADWSDKFWATVTDTLFATMEGARQEHGRRMRCPLKTK